jgi:hypothetical protein
MNKFNVGDIVRYKDNHVYHALVISVDKKQITIHWFHQNITTPYYMFDTLEIVSKA